MQKNCVLPKQRVQIQFLRSVLSWLNYTVIQFESPAEVGNVCGEILSRIRILIRWIPRVLPVEMYRLRVDSHFFLHPETTIAEKRNTTVTDVEPLRKCLCASHKISNNRLRDTYALRLGLGNQSTRIALIWWKKNRENKKKIQHTSYRNSNGQSFDEHQFSQVFSNVGDTALGRTVRSDVFYEWKSVMTSDAVTDKNCHYHRRDVKRSLNFYHTVQQFTV